MLVGKVIAITDANELYGWVHTESPSNVHDRDQHRFHVARRQIDDHAVLAARSTTFQEGNQDIEVGCMNKLLARMQDWKRQFDESSEIAARQVIELRGMQCPIGHGGYSGHNHSSATSLAMRLCIRRNASLSGSTVSLATSLPAPSSDLVEVNLIRSSIALVV